MAITLEHVAASLRVMRDHRFPLRPHEPDELASYYEGWVDDLIQRIESTTGSTEAIAERVCRGVKPWVLLD